MEACPCAPISVLVGRSRLILDLESLGPSYSPIYTVNLISLLVRFVCVSSFHTTRGSPSAVPVHLLMSSCNPFTALLSRSNFMHVSRNVVSIDGSISCFVLSLLPELEASVKLFLASMKVSLVHSKSNSGSFIRDLQTQVLSSGCFPLSSPLMIPLQSTIFTFGSSLHDLDLIIYRFSIGGDGSTPFSHILAINVRQSSIS